MTPATLLNTIFQAESERDTIEGDISELWLEFGKQIRAERKKRRIKLVAFAIDMGYTPAFISCLESGSRRWNSDMAKRAVKLLSA